MHRRIVDDVNAPLAKRRIQVGVFVVAEICDVIVVVVRTEGFSVRPIFAEGFIKISGPCRKPNLVEEQV